MVMNICMDSQYHFSSFKVAELRFDSACLSSLVTAPESEWYELGLFSLGLEMSTERLKGGSRTGQISLCRHTFLVEKSAMGYARNCLAVGLRLVLSLEKRI